MTPHSFLLRKVGVLGAGHMGSRIAAHFANAGVPSVLLDIAAPEDSNAPRSGPALKALDALKAAKPAAFFDPSLASLITPGNFDQDLERLRDCDWVIEAVAENLKIKQALLGKVQPFLRPNAVVTTNTSGLPVRQIAEQMDSGFRRRWFGTHFFNPPRYMRLVEVIPTAETDRDLVAAVSEFCDKRLGKAVVLAKDTPNFIANRIGTFVMLNAMKLMEEMGLTVEEVDTLTGSALGWPKTGTFRLSDMVGIDVLASVARNFAERVRDERPDLTLPAFVEQMVARGWLGDKAGQGFYKKVRAAGGEENRLVLDWKTLEYRTAERPKLPSLDMVKGAASAEERLKLLLGGDEKKDRAAAFYRRLLPELWSYAAHRLGEISNSAADIDRAMTAGFNWELGPFELWDAAGGPGVQRNSGGAAPAVKALREAGHGRWYRDDGAARFVFDPASGEYQAVRAAESAIRLSSVRQSGGIVRSNPGATLLDLGDGVACLEFHTKMNAIGADILSMLRETLKPDGDVVRNFDAFVIANEAANFSAGANLMQLLLAIQEQEWDDIEAMIGTFQKATAAIKFCPRPVVAAPVGLCLGGGAEVALHGASRQAHAELYLGLVETGVGLIPAGGGCKEIALRVAAAGPENSTEALDELRRWFEMVAMGKVSTSAADARKMGFLTAGDGVTMNRERLIGDAKARAKALAAAGYAAPEPQTVPALGESALATLRMGVRLMREGEFISDHDVKIANWLAYILCGGNATAGKPVREEYFLDLEREAFLSLCGEPKTAERIAHTLKTGKPLRN